MSQPASLILYRSGSGPLTQADLKAALASVGLRRGDLVLIHADLATFGKLGEVKDRGRFMQLILEAFTETVGEAGTIILPTFSYSFTDGVVYDVAGSPSRVGTFSEYVRRLPGVIRSEDPIFSHAGFGPKAAKLLSGVAESCFGPDSFYERFYRENGKLINMGKYFDITFIHYIERQSGLVDYRFDKIFTGTIKRADGTVAQVDFSYYAKKQPEQGYAIVYEMPKLGRELERRGRIGKKVFGDHEVLCSTTRDCFDVGTDMLKKDRYSFLKKDPNALHLAAFPFFVGYLDNPGNNGLPARLPFTFVLSDDEVYLTQRYSKEIEAHNTEAYRKGSLLSSNLGRGTFGVTRADDALAFLSQACGGKVSGLSFLEIGCADGYLLHRLSRDGAGKVMGCEPGPAALEGSRKFGIEIINEPFTPALVGRKLSEPFDVVFSYGVLEHLHDPAAYVKQFRACLKPDGRVFMGVPNCEAKLRHGDLGILGHEHWNYFTAEGLRIFLEDCGLSEVRTEVGRAGAMVYGWGRLREPSQGPDQAAKAAAVRHTKAMFRGFRSKTQAALAILRRRLERLEASGGTLGVYAGGLPLVSLLAPAKQPRFFNGDAAVHGKYVPGFDNAVENPANLISRPVSELWIAAIDYDAEIRRHLESELGIPKSIEIVSIKSLLESIADE